MQAALQNVVVSSQSSPGSTMPLPHTGAAPVVGSVVVLLVLVDSSISVVAASLERAVEVLVSPVSDEDDPWVVPDEDVLVEHSVTPRSAMRSSIISTTHPGIRAAPMRGIDRNRRGLLMAYFHAKEAAQLVALFRLVVCPPLVLLPIHPYVGGDDADAVEGGVVGEGAGPAEIGRAHV